MPDAASDDFLNALTGGEIVLQGRFMWGSNYTFLVDVEYEGNVIKAVYKPTKGERPLWDFPAASLAHREVAAFLVSQALGWMLVPETVYRRRGPVGSGSLQRYIEHDPEYHYFNLNAEDVQRLRPVCLFDLLINNADRKGSHLLVDADSHIWLIDHGICFHVEDKLRTVIWDFAGEDIPAPLVANLQDLLEQLQRPSPLSDALSGHLSSDEIQAIAARAAELVERGCFPDPHPSRRPYPWPPL